MSSAIIEISLLLAALILGWLKTRWAALFYIALGLNLLYALGMAIYLIAKWSTLSWRDRLLGVLALVGWLVIAWAVFHAKGLSL